MYNKTMFIMNTVYFYEYHVYISLCVLSLFCFVKLCCATDSFCE